MKIAGTTVVIVVASSSRTVSFVYFTYVCVYIYIYIYSGATPGAPGYAINRSRRGIDFEGNRLAQAGGREREVVCRVIWDSVGSYLLATSFLFSRYRRDDVKRQEFQQKRLAPRRVSIARAHARERPSRMQRLDQLAMIARFRATALVGRPAKI